FHIAGNSLGGGIALHLALDGIALSACALSPVGFVEGGRERCVLHLGLITTEKSGPAMERLMPVIGRPDPVRRALLMQYAAHADRLPLGEVVSTFRELHRATAFKATRRRAINWRCPTAAETRCPVTVAWGDRDYLLLHGPQSARAAERLPHA